MSLVSTEASLHSLIRHVVRAFYGPSETILIDLLLISSVLKDKEFIKLFCSTPKDFFKVADGLVTARLISKYRRNEYAAGSSRPTSVAYFYFDWSDVIDCLKFRLRRMDSEIEGKDEDETIPVYVCPDCAREYTSLDAATLQFSASGLHCDCGGEVVLTVSQNGSRGKIDQKLKFNNQFLYIKQQIKLIDSAVVDQIDIERYVRVNYPAVLAPSATLSSMSSGSSGGVIKPERDIPVAGTDVLNVKMMSDLTSEANKLKRQAELDAMKKQNALPSWIAKSTISTAPVEQLSGDEDDAAAQDGASALAGAKPSYALASQVKRYYADLEESGEEDEGLDFEEQDDLKPLVKTENNHVIVKKEEDAKVEETVKVEELVKLEESTLETTAVSQEIGEEKKPRTTMVAGVPMLISLIGDAEMDLMSPEEYEQYSELVLHS